MARIKDTLTLRLFGLLKIPLIAHLKPVVEELDEDHCVVRLPLKRRSKNHVESMYFGVLCVGADCAGGLLAMREIQQKAPKVSFLFKDFEAQFLKRAEGDVFFTCTDGHRLRTLVKEAERTGERVEDGVHVVATVPSKLGEEPVAKFKLTISLKKRRPKF